MPEFIREYWPQLVALLSAIGGIVAYVKTTVGALKQGQKAILYDRLQQAHKYHTGKGWISIPELKNMEYIYKAYHALGGNGTGTKLYKDMENLSNMEG